MLPKKTNDKINCLESLVGVRSECADVSYPFYLEDAEGIDISSLAKVANVNSPSGVSLGKDLINIAAREMMGDIEMLISNGFSLNDTFGDLCSTCDFALLYQSNSGVKVQSTVISNYSILRINKIEILTNRTGTETLVIDDGVTPKNFSVDLQAGVIIPVNLVYETTKNIVRIYFSDTTIGLAQIVCTSSASGCGCGGAVNKGATDTIRYSGTLAGMDSSTQYGFKICASVSCSSDLMVCDLVKQTPSAFGLTLFYKSAQKYYSGARNTQRNNRVAGNDNEQKEFMSDYFGRLYSSRLKGTKDSKSIRTIVNNYLRQRADKCVICDGLIKTGYAAG